MSTPTRPSWVPSYAVYWRGHWFDPTTRDMLVELASRSGALYIQPIQGCWSSDTEASSGTHEGACVVDLNAERFTDDQARQVETWWREQGGFGWFRPRLVNSTGRTVWQRHLHLGRKGSGMAPELATQHADYLDGYNGLPIGNRVNKDTGTRAYVGRTWADYLAEKEGTMTPEQEKRILDAIAATRTDVGKVPERTWDYPIATVDPDPNDGIAPKRYPASTYTVMANYRAQLLQAATTKALAALAELQAREDVPSGPVQDTAAVVAGVLDELAQALAS